MFTHILVATDGSNLSERAIAMAVELAKALGAKVTGITVSEPFHIVGIDAVMTITDTEDVYREKCETRATDYLSVVETAAAGAGVPVAVLHQYAEHPYEAIINAAVAHGCDSICMASHGRKGIRALVLGSETIKVLTHSTIPVLVLR